MSLNYFQIKSKANSTFMNNEFSLSRSIIFELTKKVKSVNVKESNEVPSEDTIELIGERDICCCFLFFFSGINASKSKLNQI